MRIKTTLLAVALAMPATLTAANSQIFGWNNLGMHCMDSDYSVFSVLPPYNTVEAQLIVAGKLVTDGAGYTVTYQAVADPDGSFNATAMGKNNYYDYAKALYGATLGPEGGLAGWNMPGTENEPQAMLFEPVNRPAPGVETPVNWWRAEGIPISPYDDAHRKNPYPLMRIIARDGGGTPVATNDVVLPVSDEMDCRACHASGSPEAGKPASGWVWDGFQERDFRLNILRLHDEHQFARHSALYAAALADRGFNSRGLYRGVVADNKPVLCASCHASEALGTPSFGTIPPLTSSVHRGHAHVADPVLNTTLDSSANRAACYRCHPGSTTKCLRGAMGGAVAPDGSLDMQCQACHGDMSMVGSPDRVGWFMEPNCQSCHTGTATSNNGQIRYSSAFEANGTPRVAVNATFATTPNTPAQGLSLYRFSRGHGGLQCSACHGSTHAEFPSTHRNDNLRNLALQGHAGVMVECTACHVTMTATAARVKGGPHGIHPVTQGWVSDHHDLIEHTGGSTQCRVCHGTDYRGSVLSRAQANRKWNAFDGTISFARGAIIGCYTCHQGPDEGDRNPAAAPTVSIASATTANDQAVSLPVTVTPVSATLRILAQPEHGSLGVNGHLLTYFPEPGYVGPDTFLYAAYDGSKNSTTSTGTLVVTQGPSSLTAIAHVPPTYPAGWPVAFAVVPMPVNTTAPVTHIWTFGDGGTDTNQFANHAYTVPGAYSWTVLSSAGTASERNSGTIVIGQPIGLTCALGETEVTVSWPASIADTLLEASPTLGPAAQWNVITNVVSPGAGVLSVTLPAPGIEFFRLRRPW